MERVWVCGEGVSGVWVCESVSGWVSEGQKSRNAVDALGPCDTYGQGEHQHPQASIHPLISSSPASSPVCVDPYR